MKFRTLSALMLIATVNATVYALTINEAVESALGTHPDGQIGILHQQSAVEETKIAQSALYPRIDFNGDYFPSKTFVMPSNGTFSTRQSDSFHADVTGTYLLYDFGRTSDRIDALKFQEASVSADKKLRYERIVEEVWNAYYGVAYLSQRINTARLSSKFYEEQYRKAVGMREAGFKTEADESRFKASWAEAADAYERAVSDHAKALVVLELLTGYEIKSSGISDDLDDMADSLTVPEAGALREELSRSNSVLLGLRSAISKAQSLAEASEYERYGSVNLVGAYGFDRSLSSYDSSYIGIRSSFPLYDGGKTSAESQRNRLAVSVARKEYESAERALWLELISAQKDFEQSEKTIRSKKTIIEANRKARLVMEGRYTQGLATYIDVLESQSALDGAQVALSAARLEKIRAWTKIQRLLGKGCINEICND